METLKPYTLPKRYIPKVKFTEDSLQRQVCHYLKLTYPNVIFRSDLDSGRNKEGNFHRQRMVAMNSSRSWPDLFIYEPRTVNKDGKSHHYCGLALELKAEGTTVVMKIGPRKGKLSSDKHIQEQAAMLKALIKKGYYANFAVGFDDAIRQIDRYMGRSQAYQEAIF